MNITDYNDRFNFGITYRDDAMWVLDAFIIDNKIIVGEQKKLSVALVKDIIAENKESFPDPTTEVKYVPDYEAKVQQQLVKELGENVVFDLNFIQKVLEVCTKDEFIVERKYIIQAYESTNPLRHFIEFDMEFREAFKRTTKAIKSITDDPAPFWERSRLYQRAERWDEAITDISRAIILTEKQGWQLGILYLPRIALFMEKSDGNSALDDGIRALRIDRKNITSGNLAHCIPVNLVKYNLIVKEPQSYITYAQMTILRCVKLVEILEDINQDEDEFSLFKPVGYSDKIEELKDLILEIRQKLNF